MTEDSGIPETEVTQINWSVTMETTFSISSMTSDPGTNDLPSLTTSNAPPPSAPLTLHDILSRYTEYRAAEGIGLYGYPVVIILGTIGNVLSFLIMAKPSMRKTSTCFYMAVLAVFDTLVLYFNCFRQWLALLHRWDALRLSSAACKTFNFLSYTFFDMAVWIIVAMTIERFIAVYFPFKAPKFATVSRARKVIVFLLLLFIATNVHFFWTVTIDDQGYCRNLDEFTHFHDNIWPWIDATIYSFIPFFVLIVFNILIIYENRKSFTRRSTMRNGGGTMKVKSSGFQFRLSTMLLTVSFVFLLLSAPNAILICIRQKYFDFTSGVPDFRNIAVYTLVSRATTFCLYVNHSINFLLYCVSGQRFRRELKNLITCKWTVKQIRASALSMSDITRSQRLSESSDQLPDAAHNEEIQGSNYI